MSLIDGKLVWVAHATHGLPLEISLPILFDEGIMPTWDTLLGAAQQDGANIERLVSRLVVIAGDVYPPEVNDVVRQKLPLLEKKIWRRT